MHIPLISLLIKVILLVVFLDDDLLGGFISGLQVANIAVGLSVSSLRLQLLHFDLVLVLILLQLFIDILHIDQHLAHILSL